VLEHKSAQQALAREEQAVQDCESRRQAAARSNRTLDMACKYIEGDYIFHQPCGLWNAPCVHALRVPSPIVIDTQDEEKMLRQWLTLVCQ
jgi:hypothetical protein